VEKVDTFTDQQHSARQHARALNWQFYPTLEDQRIFGLAENALDQCGFWGNRGAIRQSDDVDRENKRGAG
jgi:hypothetical protein